MSFNIGVLNAAVTLDNSDFKRNAEEVPQIAEFNFRKAAELAVTYLSFRSLWNFSVAGIQSFSDLQEACNKFDNVFKAIPATSGEVADALIRDFDLSERAAKDMLSATGDLLTGFGFSAETALELSDQAARLGADLASYTNYSGGAKGAAEALTAAMLGETERAKALGIVIRQDSEEYKSLVKGYRETRGATEQQAKAMAALEIATRQSQNAIGDWSRPGETLAQTSMKMTQATDTFTAAVGSHLSSAVHPLQKAYVDLLKGFNGLAPSYQRIILNTAALSAGMLLLQTSTGKALNAKLKLAAVQLTGGGIGIQAKAEAAAVEAAEAQKQAAYTKTSAVRAMHDKVAEARIARQNVAEARLALAKASVNLEIAKGSGSLAAETTAKKQLLVASQALSKAQSAEAQATAGVAQAHLVARNAIAQHTAATQVSAAANATAAKATTACGRAQLYLTGGLKAAAGGVKALFAALGPIGWLLLAVTAASAAWEWAIDRTRDKLNGLIAVTEKAAQKASEEAEANSRARDAYQTKADRLKELAGYTDKNNDEIEEAARLAKELNDRYGDLGISVNELTGEVSIAADAWNKLSEAEKRFAESRLETQISATTDNIRAALQGALNDAPLRNYLLDNEGYGKLKDTLGNASDSVDVLPELALSQLEEQANTERRRGNTEYADQLDTIAEKIKKLIELNKQLSAVQRQGAKGGAVPDEKSKETQEQRRAREQLEKARWDKEYNEADADKQAEMLDKKKSELQEELKKSAGNKEEKNYSKEELEIAKQIVDLERQREEIRKKSADSFRDEQESFQKSEEKRIRDNAKKQTDREIAKQERTGDQDAVKKRLEDELKKAKETADDLKRKYDQAIKDAQADGVLTDEERKKIQEARQNLDDAMADQDSWSNKIADLEAKDQKAAKSAVTFSSEVLSAMLGPSPPEKETAKNTKRSVDVLRRIEKKVDKAKAAEEDGVTLE